MNLTPHEQEVFKSTAHLGRVERIREIRERLGMGMMDAKRLIDREELERKIETVDLRNLAQIRGVLRDLFKMIP